jgi:hypothetical protein
LKNPIACNSKNTAYKNGKTFEDCKEDAKKISLQLSQEIQSNNQITWKKILETVDHDEIIYKLTLKYLRESGYDIGNYLNPIVKKGYNDTRHKMK